MGVDVKPLKMVKCKDMDHLLGYYGCVFFQPENAFQDYLLPISILSQSVNYVIIIYICVCVCV